MDFLTFNEIIKDPLKFQSFVRQLADGFRAPKFSESTVDTYNETTSWKAVTAFNGRIPMATSISKYSGKPLIGTEKPIDMFGEMPTFGNKVTFTSKEFNEIEKYEKAIRQGVTDPTPLINYLNGYFERLAVGPLMTIDKLYFEALSNGTSSIAAGDIILGLPFSIDWKLKTGYVDTIWSDAANADGLKDLQDMADDSRINDGIIIEKFLMNTTTFKKLQSQVSVKTQISSYYNGVGGSTYFTGKPNLNAINEILTQSLLIAPIVLVDNMVSKYATDGASIASNTVAFQDNRVAGVVGDIHGSYLWTPADEQRRPDSNVIYQDVNHVLIRTEQKHGKVTFESELSAIVVPNMNDEIVILKTDSTS